MTALVAPNSHASAPVDTKMTSAITALLANVTNKPMTMNTSIRAAFLLLLSALYTAPSTMRFCPLCNTRIQALPVSPYADHCAKYGSRT
ncbi:MAG: hypothetical protein JWN23_2798 [Rhodocyclales bacterium]|nr:hypothetical protein [Rhodocyclales bacterium]